MSSRPLDHRSIVRLVLDRAELGGAILDVEILDRALARRHRRLEIHNLYFSIAHVEARVETVGDSVVHWHPIPYVKATAGENRGALLAALRSAFLTIVDAVRPALFVNHVPENQSGLILSQAARRRGLPVLGVFHGGERPSVVLDEDHARAIDVVAANLRAAAGLADAMSAVSESAGRMIPMARVRNLGTAADASLFDPRGIERGFLRARFGFPAPLPILLLAGRIVPEKGHKVLLDASQLLFERDLDHRIVFAGAATHDARTRIEEYVVKNGFDGAVGFVFDASQHEMVSIYADADVVVLPTFHFEGCPRCLIEAGLMETVVVASDAGGSREAFLPGETGVLVPPGDPRALADALAGVLSDPGRRVSMGRAGRAFAIARFDPDALAARHEEVYASMMAIAS